VHHDGHRRHEGPHPVRQLHDLRHGVLDLLYLDHPAGHANLPANGHCDCRTWPRSSASETTSYTGQTAMHRPALMTKQPLFRVQSRAVQVCSRSSRVRRNSGYVTPSPIQARGFNRRDVGQPGSAVRRFGMRVCRSCVESCSNGCAHTRVGYRSWSAGAAITTNLARLLWCGFAA